MRIIFVIVAIGFVLVLIFASIAEDMAAPSTSLPLMFVADKCLAFASLCVCVIALARTRVAAAIIWCLIVIHAALSVINGEAGQITQGVLRYAFYAALSMSAGALFERS